MKVVWTESAEADLDHLVRHIAADDVEAALRIEDRIVAAATRLATHPHQGRRGRLANTRELVITRTPYLFIYRSARDALEIIRVVHGAQQWPPRES